MKNKIKIDKQNESLYNKVYRRCKAGDILSGEFKYLSIYNYYKELISDGKLSGGDKMPSIRKCAQQHSLSRTTVQTAYDFLSADGYIIAKPQSGYYVSRNAVTVTNIPQKNGIEEKLYKYDLASERADSQSFDFKLWQRYIRSAMRQNERLLSYGEPQGEYDLRCTLADYLKKTRSAVCTSENVVIGAGTQTLLQLILPLIRDRKTVYFTNPTFVHGKTAFTDFGFQICDDIKRADVVYITPSRLKGKGDVMIPGQRFEIVNSIAKSDKLIIEDDYGSEFSGYDRPTPCIQGLCGGKSVIYLGTLSKLLIPSIRISYMLLPPELLTKYSGKKAFYNQTASKIEQIAVNKFIQDGHLGSQIRKIRRLYIEKAELVKDIAAAVFGEKADLRKIDSGRYLRLSLPSQLSDREIAERAAKSALKIAPDGYDGKNASFILSFYGAGSDELKKSFEIIDSIIKE